MKNEVDELKGTTYILYIIDHQEYLFISEEKVNVKIFYMTKIVHME